MNTTKTNQVLIPIDVANRLLGTIAATAPRGQAHADELLALYHSLASAVAQTRTMQRAS